MYTSAGEVADGPPAVVAVTSTAPAVPAGVVAVQVVAVVQATPVAGAPPKDRVVEPVTKPVPVTVTPTPPATGPAAGATAVTRVAESTVAEPNDLEEIRFRYNRIPGEDAFAVNPQSVTGLDHQR